MQTVAKVWENLKCAAPENIHTSHMEVHWIFQGGGCAKKKSIQEWRGKTKLKNVQGRGMDIFWNSTVAVVTAFLVLPSFHLCFHGFTEHPTNCFLFFLVCDSKDCLVYLVHYNKY